MSSFPDSQERTVASSLLLLGTSPPSPSHSLSTPRFDHDLNDSLPSERRSSKSFRESSVSSGSKSSSSALTNDDGDSSEEEIKLSTISFCSAISRYRQMKFKIVRKIRSKIIWTSSSSSNYRKPNSGEGSKMSSGSVSTEVSSCLSSNSSGISSARSLRYVQRARGGAKVKVLGNSRLEPRQEKQAVGSPHLRRRADAILKLLSHGGTSEVRIRQLLGDSPDTSKALRMLLRVDAVKRSGSGGRHDPFIYTITG